MIYQQISALFMNWAPRHKQCRNSNENSLIEGLYRTVHTGQIIYWQVLAWRSPGKVPFARIRVQASGQTSSSWSLVTDIQNTRKSSVVSFFWPNDEIKWIILWINSSIFIEMLEYVCATTAYQNRLECSIHYSENVNVKHFSNRNLRKTVQ